jgi:hypothetical protein
MCGKVQAGSLGGLNWVPAKQHYLVPPMLTRRNPAGACGAGRKPLGSPVDVKVESTQYKVSL